MNAKQAKELKSKRIKPGGAYLGITISGLPKRPEKQGIEKLKGVIKIQKEGRNLKYLL